MAYASLDDVRTAYEGTIPAEADGRVQYLLDVVSVRLDALIPSLADRAAVNPDLGLLARHVVVQAVLRQYRNPAEMMTQTESRGPFSATVSYGAAATQANRRLFDEADLRMLYPPATAGRVGSIQLSGQYWKPS